MLTTCVHVFISGVCVCSVTSVMSNSCDPMDCSPARLLCPWDPQARTLGWVAVSSSRVFICCRRMQEEYFSDEEPRVLVKKMRHSRREEVCYNPVRLELCQDEFIFFSSQTHVFPSSPPRKGRNQRQLTASAHVPTRGSGQHPADGHSQGFVVKWPCPGLEQGKRSPYCLIAASLRNDSLAT